LTRRERPLFLASTDTFYREDNATQAHFGHIGLYAYRRDILLKLATLTPTPLEKAEALEQLRALENGINIRVVEVEKRSPAVDRPEDLKHVLQALQKEKESTFVGPVPFGSGTFVR